MARTRYRADFDRIKLGDLPAGAMRAVWREGYTRADLRADVLAGLVVGIVALPLAMALAIAVGVAPQYGLYTSIVAGAVVAALGGSRLQVTGPTAAFIVILAPIYSRFGMSGLLLSGLMGGLDADRHGPRPSRPVHRVHPAPGHHRFHRRHRHRHRHAAGQGRPRAQPVARARELLRSNRADVAGPRLGVARRSWPSQRPRWRSSSPFRGSPGGFRRRWSPFRWPACWPPSSTTCGPPTRSPPSPPDFTRRSAAASSAAFPRFRRCRCSPGPRRGRAAPLSISRCRRCASCSRAPSPWRCSVESSRCSPR